jgi:6-phosphogluconolactonase
MKDLWQFTIVGGAMAFALAGACWGAETPVEEYFVYFGTYTEFKLPSFNHLMKSQSKGIYVSRFRPDAGEFSPPELAAETVNPSYVAIHPNQRYLYAVIEDPLALGNLRDKASSIRAFAINRATGKLGLLNTVPANGGSSCYLSADKSGKYIMVANFTTGNIVVWRIKDDGSIGEQTGFMQHTGTSALMGGPRAHWVGLSPDSRFAISTDLGTDQLLIDRFDMTRGSLAPNDPRSVSLPSGCGPRHFLFGPDGKFGYAVTEFSGEVMAYSWDPIPGALKHIQTVSARADVLGLVGGGSEMALHPNGKFLYAGHRGSDIITVFAIDSAKGTLTKVQQEPTRGMAPRGFGIDPTGKFLVVANEVTDTVIAFEVDATSGKLAPTYTVLKVDSPTCVKFARIDLPME